MKVWLNGEDVEIAEATVAGVLRALGLQSGKGIALAIDGEVVPKSTWGEVAISSDQRIEVVKAVQGG